MRNQLNRKLFHKDLTIIFREVKVFFLTNIFISLTLIALLLFIDFEFLDFTDSESIFSLELVIVIIYVILQLFIFISMVFYKFSKSKKPILSLIEEEESSSLEFKSSVRWDYRQNKLNKDLEHSILKTIAAFSNTNGGTLLIGISDEKEIIGLDKDYSTLKRKDKDGLLQHIATLFINSIGKDIINNSFIDIVALNGKDVCRVDVLKAKDPVFVSTKTGDEFFIRTANITTQLSVKEAYAYIKKWK
jgi:hypothetical protein